PVSCLSSGKGLSSSSFIRQPSCLLIVDASPPWWSETSTVLCQALENKFFLASSLAGPAHLPLLSVFAVSVKLPFVPVKSNLTRLLSYIEELRSLPQEAALQQFKQYMCHTANGDFNSSCVEVRTFTAKTKVLSIPYL
uniref:Uncharacterized protein n=1 Tax=Cyprinus carpio carpio TaxID=630221 RepID=A0A8C1C172_CYPCA